MFSQFAWNDKYCRHVDATSTERINDKSSDYIFNLILITPNQEKKTTTIK